MRIVQGNSSTPQTAGMKFEGFDVPASVVGIWTTKLR